MGSASSISNLFILVILVTALASSSTPMVESRSLSNPSSSTLATRLKLDQEGSNCWESLLHLQQCSGEIITFFLNGETYLGPACCQAIRVIGHDCWPNIVRSLGFTPQETDILEGYCDEEDEHHHSSPSTPLLPLPKLEPRSESLP